MSKHLLLCLFTENGIPEWICWSWSFGFASNSTSDQQVPVIQDRGHDHKTRSAIQDRFPIGLLATFSVGMLLWLYQDIVNVRILMIGFCVLAIQIIWHTGRGHSTRHGPIIYKTDLWLSCLVIYSLSDYVESTPEVVRIILTTDLSIFAVPMAELSRIHVMCLVWQAIRAKNLRPIVRMINFWHRFKIISWWKNTEHATRNLSCTSCLVLYLCPVSCMLDYFCCKNTKTDHKNELYGIQVDN